MPALPCPRCCCCCYGRPPTGTCSRWNRPTTRRRRSTGATSSSTTTRSRHVACLSPLSPDLHHTTCLVGGEILAGLYLFFCIHVCIFAEDIFAPIYMHVFGLRISIWRQNTVTWQHKWGWGGHGGGGGVARDMWGLGHRIAFVSFYYN